MNLFNLNAFARAVAEALAIHPSIRLLHCKLDQIMSDQSHLDDDVQKMTTAFTDVISELKAQVAAAQAAGTPVPIDFTKADALVASIQAEAANDAPIASTAVPPPTTPPPAPVAQINP